MVVLVCLPISVAAYFLERVEEQPEEGKEGQEAKWHMRLSEIFSLQLPTDGHRLSVVKLAPGNMVQKKPPLSTR